MTVSGRRALVAAALCLLAACARREEVLPPQVPPEPRAEGDVEPSIGPAMTGIRIGEAIPKAEVKLTATDGRLVSVGGVRGTKGTLVVFTCNQCPYARAWEERIVALGNEYLGHGIGVVAINANDPATVPEDGLDEMKRRASSRGMRYPYVVDETSEVARAFGATRTPEAFVFDSSGRLAYRGTIDDNAQDKANVTQFYLRDALAAVVSGEPVPMAITKALGCSIKFRGSPTPPPP